MKPHTTVIISFHYRVVVVSLLHRAKFPSQPSEVAQALDPIPGQNLVRFPFTFVSIKLHLQSFLSMRCAVHLCRGHRKITGTHCAYCNDRNWVQSISLPEGDETIR